MRRQAALSALLLLAACSSGGVTASHAWVRTPLPGKSMTAGYLELANRTDQAIVLTGAAATGFGSVSIHQTRFDEGMAKMLSVPRMEIAAGERVVFAPGGLHLMLMQPERAFSQGDTLTISLSFADGSRLEIPAVMRENAP